jgi:hypothetical protein
MINQRLDKVVKYVGGAAYPLAGNHLLSNQSPGSGPKKRRGEPAFYWFSSPKKLLHLRDFIHDGRLCSF